MAKFDTYQESFSSLQAGWQRNEVYIEHSSDLTASNGLRLTATGTYIETLTWETAYDLTNSSVYFNVASLSGQFDYGADYYFGTLGVAFQGDWLGWKPNVAGTSFQPAYSLGFIPILVTGGTSVGTSNVLLKIREASGIIYWEYSTNAGQSWTLSASASFSSLVDSSFPDEKFSPLTSGKAIINIQTNNAPLGKFVINGINVGAGTGTEVTPQEPIQNGNVVTIPAQTGVIYQVSGSTVTGTVAVPIGGLTVNAVASAGYTLTGTTSWSFSYQQSVGFVDGTARVWDGTKWGASTLNSCGSGSFAPHKAYVLI